MDLKLLCRWLESLGVVPDRTAPSELHGLFQNGLLAEQLLFHFTGKHAVVQQANLKQIEYQKQNWFSTLKQHKMGDLTVPAAISEKFVLAFLERVFQEFVYKPICTQAAQVLEFVHKVLGTAGIAGTATSLDELRIDVVQKPFVPVLAQLMYPHGDILKQCGSGELKQVKTALPIILQQNYTVLMTPEELVTTSDAKFLAFQVYIWMAEVSPNLVLQPVKLPHAQGQQELAASVNNVLDDVALSYGLVNEFVHVQVQSGQISLKRYEALASEPGAPMRQIPDLVKAALHEELGYFNPIVIDKEEIDQMLLEKNELLFASRGVCFKAMAGAHEFRLGFVSQQEAADAGQLIAGMLSQKRQ